MRRFSIEKWGFTSVGVYFRGGFFSATEVKHHQKTFKITIKLFYKVDFKRRFFSDRIRKLLGAYVAVILVLSAVSSEYLALNYGHELELESLPYLQTKVGEEPMARHHVRLYLCDTSSRDK